MSNRIVLAVCPCCRAEVEGEEHEFAAALQCPACGKRGQFRILATNEELVREGVSKAAHGLGRTGKSLGRVIGGTLSRGAKGMSARLLRRKTLKRLIHAVSDAMEGRKLSPGRLDALEAECKVWDISLESVSSGLRPEVVDAFFVMELERLGGEYDGEKVKHLRRCISMFRPGSFYEDRLMYIELRRETLLEIRQGRLTPMAEVEQLITRNSELVWYQGAAVYISQKKSAPDEIPEGILSITNLRIVFTSREKSIEMSWGDINMVDVEGSYLFLSGRREQSRMKLLVEDAPLAKEYVLQTLKVFHRQVDVGFDRPGRQRISQEVKQAVYQRDMGQCVQCGASDYLEYDHVIPVAKGGANTAENLQLLCRRCNLKKGAKI